MSTTRQTATQNALQHSVHYRRLRRQVNRLRGAGYAVVTLAALVAAGLQPPHAADVEVGTVRVATAAGGELASWVTTSPSGLR